MIIITNATREISILYCDKTIKNGKVLTKLAKDAPAPRAINSAGRAQQIKVEDDASKEK